LRRRLEVERDAKVEVMNQLAAEGRYAPGNGAAIKVLERDVAVLNAQISRLPGNVEKSEVSALDLLEQGIATNFARRGGQSFNVDASVGLPTSISKSADALDAQLRAESMGIRRPAANVRKADGDDELLSNNLGLRNTRMKS
jgi:hypothetical protein